MLRGTVAAAGAVRAHIIAGAVALLRRTVSVAGAVRAHIIARTIALLRRTRGVIRTPAGTVHGILFLISVA